MKKGTKHMLTLFAALSLFCAAAPRVHAEKYDALPPVFETSVTVSEEEQRTEPTKTYSKRYLLTHLRREYINTTNPVVNQEMRSLVDAYYDTFLPDFRKIAEENKYNNYFDIGTNYHITGQSWMSLQTIASIVREQEYILLDFTTRTYDLKTGKRILLTDLFADDSPAWDLLAQGVAQQLGAAFEGDPRNPAGIAALCGREALEQADFTLSGAELTLHYRSNTLYAGRNNILHVRFYYPELRDMMTGEAARQTDNSQWKMVALTFDDGPKLKTSEAALQNMRISGMRATYFIWGLNAEKNPGIALRQGDQNHQMASHSMNHNNGYGLTVEQRIRNLERFRVSMLNLIGEAPTVFRAPGGLYPPWVEAKIDYPIIQWSVDTYDYKHKTHERTVELIRQYVQDGDIVLMHDTGDFTFQGIEEIAAYLKSQGFLMVTVDELAAAQGVSFEPAVVYYRCLDGEYLQRTDSNTN